MQELRIGRSVGNVLLPPRRSHREVQSVTTAGQPRSDDLTRRQIQYAVAMSIRIICFILAVVVPIGPLTWAFVAGAMVLPYIAVVLANASNGESSRGSLVSPDREMPRLSDRVSYRLPHHGGHGHSS